MGKALFPQLLLDTHEEIICDLFAGGGGASLGIEMGTGRQVDVAINHDSAAVNLHAANHPQTRHLVSDVFEVDPRAVCDGRPVGLLWASPDCTYHSKARGGKPIRDKNRKRRALAWVVTRWAGQVRPRVIMLENVEEFADWGPLVGPPDALRPCKRRKGRSFRRWVRSLQDLGYVCEWRELRACDYGAPTIRKRFFFIARCDGQPIVWPAKTHGAGLKPFRTAAECIDWTIPMLSIFATKEEARDWGRANNQAAPIRPLADNTMRRIARGVKRYVLENPRPYLVTLAHGEESASGSKRWGSGVRSLDEPMTTLTASNEAGVVAPVMVSVANSKTTGRGPNAWPVDDVLRTITSTNPFGVVAPYLVPRYGEREGQEPRSRSIEEPLPTVVNDGNGGSLVAAHLATYHTERDEEEARGQALSDPAATLDTQNRHAVVASFLAQNNGGFNEADGRSLEEPVSTVLTSSRGHHGLIAANLIKEKGTGVDADVAAPLHTIGAGGTHHGLVAAHMQADFGQSVGSDLNEPMRTVTGGANGHAAMVAAFLQTYYGQGIGQKLDEPMRTVPTLDNFGFVAVQIDGQTFYIADIAMRMLQPRELYRAQGFPDSYIIDRGADGRLITKTEQVRMVGNSVCPDVAAALIAANVPEMVVRRAA